jgi:DNA polymerase I-like protein with 3'-5' exonuclease and polymerase domains
MAPLRGQDITTVFGRRKRHGLVSQGNIAFLQNEAANMPHQSIASDITLHTAIRTYETLANWDVKIVNLIHDAILLEVPKTNGNEMRHRVVEYVSKTFAQVPVDYGITAVPFKADAAYGHRWGSLEEYTG